MLLAKGSGVNIALAARGIARSVARELLSPMLDAACARLGFVLRRAYDVACERQQLLEGTHLLQTRDPDRRGEMKRAETLADSTSNACKTVQHQSHPHVGLPMNPNLTLR